MVASLVARQLTVVRGPLVVLDGVDLTLSPGRRVGLVGPNGVGKSTLLGALAGVVPLDRGVVEVHPPTADVGLLSQERERSDVETVRAFLARRTGVAGAQAELDAATNDLASGARGADERYASALDRWLALGAADLDARVGDVGADLGLPAGVLDLPTAALSGGQAARAALASLLLSRFDVVLLDEPTNDLDLGGLERLERWLLDVAAPVMVVSHDRAFLERVATDVVEIDHHTHQCTWFAGGWQAYLDERARARRQAEERYEEYAAKRAALVQRVRREREWAAQGKARVRRSGETDKHIRHFQVDQTEQLAGRAARTQRALERLEAVDEPREPWELRLSIPDVGRSGDVVATARGVVVDRSSFRLGPVDLDIRLGDRVALVGPNGSGKTTLLDVLVGRLRPGRGTATLGSGVVVGEVEQTRIRLEEASTLLAAVTAATGTTDVDARTLLAKFGLRADHVGRSPATLSPGERTRASLALLMANGANLLVLDEPTNHLDLPAIEQLERALDTFAGTLLLVTHDRRLLDGVRITRTVDVVDGVVSERN